MAKLFYLSVEIGNGFRYPEIVANPRELFYIGSNK